MNSKMSIAAAVCAVIFGATAAQAEWKPTKPVEFVVTSGAGGGTDTFARTIQSIIAKNNLMEAPVVVVNKGGGSGAEGYVYGAGNAGNPYKLIFGTNNQYLLPYVAKLGYKPADMVPVASMALDEFLIWVNAEAPYKDIKDFVDAAKKPEGLKMGGSQSKDTDQTLVSIVQNATGAKFTYIPFKSGGEAAVQLAGAHIDANVNNPNENFGQWKAGMVRPLCVFSANRMAAGPKVAGDMSWSDIPTCKEGGLNVENYQMPRTVWLPAGVPDDAVKFFVDVLTKAQQTPEWKSYIERTSQTDRFLTGDEMRSFVKADEEKAVQVFKKEGWAVQ
ncbi:tripartite-type tricarboxylate transporter receptor subunit TctC [Skermanella aerolata]|jgi:putative tricarboxylic transport membrane protein|uniref:Bug family tripartite tricarboxylate transporter substrate binding protein n=1 Tax=Skermanella aerolata TaxID=393310 RepID=UPI003D1907AF